MKGTLRPSLPLHTARFGEEIVRRNGAASCAPAGRGQRVPRRAALACGRMVLSARLLVTRSMKAKIATVGFGMRSLRTESLGLTALAVLEVGQPVMGPSMVAERAHRSTPPRLRDLSQRSDALLITGIAVREVC